MSFGVGLVKLSTMLSNLESFATCVAESSRASSSSALLLACVCELANISRKYSALCLKSSSREIPNIYGKLGREIQ